MKTIVVRTLSALFGVGLLMAIPAAANPYILSNVTGESCGGTYCFNLNPQSTLAQWSVPISGGHMVTNSFSIKGHDRAGRGEIVYWGEVPARIDWAITTEPFGGTTMSTGSQTFTSPHELAPGLFFLTFDLYGYLQRGTYWLQIAEGLGVGPWDVCDGPSQAFAYDNGQITRIPSETFFVVAGGPVVITPEPPMLLPFGLSLLVSAVCAARKMPA